MLPWQTTKTLDLWIQRADAIGRPQIVLRYDLLGKGGLRHCKGAREDADAADLPSLISLVQTPPPIAFRQPRLSITSAAPAKHRSVEVTWTKVARVADQASSPEI